MKVQWKKVGMGVLAASIGAAVFGAVQYMFLASQAPVGDLFGVPYDVVLPFVLGVLGMIGAIGFTKPGSMRDVVTFGSAAAIGFAIATYANWLSPVVAARARASAAVPTRMVAPPRVLKPPVALTSAGTKLI